MTANRELNSQVAIVFEPASGSHALLETVFFAQFSPEVDVQQLGEQLADVMEFLPQKSPIQGFKIMVGTGGTETNAVITGGWEFSRVGPDGSVEWVFRVTPEGLSVHCLAYTRWDEVWAKASDILFKALGKVPSGVGLAGIGMKVIDRFRFTGDTLGTYDLLQLARRPNQFIADRAFSAGHRWHCHTGWFDAVAGDDSPLASIEVLNQLNIDAAPQIEPAGEKLFVMIDHNQVARSPSGPLVLAAGSDVWVSELMRQLHDANKKVLADIVTDEMARRINLVVGERK